MFRYLPICVVLVVLPIPADAIELELVDATVWAEIVINPYRELPPGNEPVLVHPDCTPPSATNFSYCIGTTENYGGMAGSAVDSGDGEAIEFPFDNSGLAPARLSISDSSLSITVEAAGYDFAIVITDLFAEYTFNYRDELGETRIDRLGIETFSASGEVLVAANGRSESFSIDRGNGDLEGLRGSLEFYNANTPPLLVGTVPGYDDMGRIFPRRHALLLPQEFDLGNGDLALFQVVHDINSTYTVIPEPGTATTIGIGLIVMAARRYSR